MPGECKPKFELLVQPHPSRLSLEPHYPPPPPAPGATAAGNLCGAFTPS